MKKKQDAEEDLQIFSKNEAPPLLGYVMGQERPEISLF